MKDQGKQYTPHFITNSNFDFSTHIPPMTEHMAMAIVSLADAVKANASAIESIAEALKGPYINNNSIGIKMDQPK